MPIYEYDCKACGARVSLFFRSISAVTDPKCDRCGSTELERLMSRVTVLRSADYSSALDDDLGLDENDPRAMAAWARRMRSEMGDEGGPEMDEMIDRLERGESLDDGYGEDEYGDDGGLGHIAGL
jgi:putative FmdB family regulatory protein